MGLQINPPSRLEGPEGAADNGDDWGTRIAKLIPAEALGLYGSAAALVPETNPWRTGALWIVVLVACGLLVLIRSRSALDPQTRKPQVGAIVISLVSFFIWLIAVGSPPSPIRLPEELQFAGPLAALLWGTMVPYFYRGE
ncbi:MAG: hypothetical protein HOP96_01400 [Sphingomonas sp.]|nr:hypothetical protein [Sphingomonas sp.]